MGRPDLSVLVGSMYHLLVCWIILATFTTHSAKAISPDLPLYPVESADEDIIRRLQLILSQWGRKHLRQQLQEPQFTFHFPEQRNQEFQSDFFAVPPSDPRYYQEPPQAPLALDEFPGLKDEGKRVEEAEVRNSDAEGIEQVLPPITPGEEDWADTDDVTSETPSDDKQDGSYVFKKFLPRNSEDIILVAIIAGCGAAAAAGVVALSIGWYKLHNNSKAAADIEYPAYGVTGPNKEISPTGDRRLAQSAQMYHYQHQKQQIIAMESNRATNERRGSVSEGDSDEENEEGDYTVYECPGLAATGELEVKNPLFLDDPTPATAIKDVDESSAPADKK